MTTKPTPSTAWFLALLLCIVGGLVVAVELIVTWPLPVFVAAWALFIGGLGATGAFAFHDQKVLGQGFWAALGQGWRTFARGLWELFP